MIELDGSAGEGGGQVLRGALALAAATGRAFRIVGIRARRKKPGLLRQHLTAVRAVATVCAAEVSGAELGASVLEFTPGPALAGRYRFDTGSAGGTTLVAQALLPALARLDAPSRVDIVGGTHNPLAPPFEYLAEVLAPTLARLGWHVTPTLVRHGFVPAGGGQLALSIAPATAAPAPLVLTERGARTGAQLRAIVANLPVDIARRELATLRAALGWPAPADPEAEAAEIVHTDACTGAGNAVLARVDFEHVRELVIAHGERGRAAERVAAGCADELRGYLRATAPVGEYLADQLLVPLALTRGGRLRVVTWSSHAETQRLLLRTWFERDLVVTPGTAAADGVTVDVPAMG